MGSILYPGASDNISIESFNTNFSNKFVIPDKYSEAQFPTETKPIMFNKNYYKHIEYDDDNNKYYIKERITNKVDSKIYWDSDGVAYVKSKSNPYNYGPYSSRSDYRPGRTARNMTGSSSGFNYAQKYDDTSIKWDVDGETKTFSMEDTVYKLHKTFGYKKRDEGLDVLTGYYNRYKIAVPESAFTKAFPHIFFVRPDCNLLNEGFTALLDKVASDPEFFYCWKKDPQLIKQLVVNNGMWHDWMFLLSNKAASFSLTDEYIKTGTYGKTYTGHGITYGKNNIESKASGEFSISYADDKNLNIYRIHKLWMDYISNLFRGTFEPVKSNIFNKILDYPTAVYYVVCGEDDETILFWSKYYGVFPSTAPSTQFSWASGNIIEEAKFDISYKYSFKEDYNPISLLEINNNTRMRSTVGYIPNYDESLMTCGENWVGAPIIELDTTNNNYVFKLKFKDPAD